MCDILLDIIAIDILHLNVHWQSLNVVSLQKHKILKAQYRLLLTIIGNYLVQVHNVK